MTSEGQPAGPGPEKGVTATAADLFHCKMCGDCCRGYGGTRVTEQDIRNISEYCGLDAGTFVERFCQMSGKKPVLAQGENGRCVFWDRVCTIHPVKPVMCKAWPFIRPVLVDVSNWHAMASVCPGIRTDLPDPVIRDGVEDILLGRNPRFPVRK